MKGKRIESLFQVSCRSITWDILPRPFSDGFVGSKANLAEKAKYWI